MLNYIPPGYNGIKKRTAIAWVDILVQISAIKSALKNIGYSVTDRHMKHCISDAITKGEGDDSIDELMAVLKIKEESHWVTIEVQGMTCGHCKSSVEGALSELEGVNSQMLIWSQTM